MTIGKYIALTTHTFVDKVMSLPFYILSRFVIALLPRNKCPRISWLQSLSAVILEAKKIKSVTASTFSPSVCHDVIKLTLLFQSCFRFTAKVRERYRQFPFTPCPCSCSNPTIMNTSHFHPQSGVRVYTYLFN